MATTDGSESLGAHLPGHKIRIKLRRIAYIFAIEATEFPDILPDFMPWLSMPNFTKISNMLCVVLSLASFDSPRAEEYLEENIMVNGFAAHVMAMIGTLPKLRFCGGSLSLESIGAMKMLP